MIHRLTLLASGLLLLAGCTMGPQVTTPGKGATLILQPEVVSAPYRTQAPAIYYTEHDVHRMVVSLFTVSDGVETAVTVNGAPVTHTIPRGAFDAPVVFKNLHAHTTYRAKCEAYMVSGVPEVETPIGTNDANSYTDIVVTDDERPTLGTLKVRLKAKPFSGNTGFDVIITDGKVVAEGAETLGDGGTFNLDN